MTRPNAETLISYAANMTAFTMPNDRRTAAEWGRILRSLNQRGISMRTGAGVIDDDALARGDGAGKDIGIRLANGAGIRPTAWLHRRYSMSF